MSDTLILNSDGQPLNLLPLSTVTWKESIKASFLNKVYVLDYYDDWVVRTQKEQFRVPSVVMIKKFVKRANTSRLTRENLYIRDEYTCQYCLNKFDFDRLTYDHVVPQSRGGQTEWENLVAACKPCNSDKADKIIYPKRAPKVPTYWELTTKRLKLPVIIRHYSWKRFIDAGDAGFKIVEPNKNE